MAVRIQIRNGTSSEWSNVNPVLMEGELAIETDTRKFKIGNGTQNWNDLPYATQGEKGETGEQGTAIVSVIRTSGDGSSGTIDTYTITYSDTTTSTFQVYNGANGLGDMLKSVYDTNNNGKVDLAENAEKVNNLTVETAVPSSAKFTDTITPIANNLTETVVGKALDATQGKLINDSLTAVEDDLVAHKLDYVEQIDLKITSLLGKHDIKDSQLEQPVGANLFFYNSGGIVGTVSKKIDVIANNKYYVAIKFATNTNNNINYLRAYSGAIIPAATMLATMVNVGLLSSVVFTSPNTDSIVLGFRNNLVGSNYYHDYSVVINLTSIFGVNNEPTKTEMDMLINILGGWVSGEITLTQKQNAIWLLNMIRQNRSAIVALGGTII